MAQQQTKLPWLAIAAAALMLAGESAPAYADKTRMLGDWTATCWTRQQRCAAETDADARAGRSPYRLALSISRRNGAETGWQIGFRIRGAAVEPDASFILKTGDGAEFRFAPGGYSLGKRGRFVTLSDAGEIAWLLPALRGGGRLRLTFTGARHGETSATYSLRGLAAALTWIDRQQGRVGNSDAIAAAKSVEAPVKVVEPSAKAVQTPVEPSVKAVEPSAKAVAVPAPVLARHFAMSECEPLENGYSDPRWTSVAPLSDNKILYVIPCFIGAYNIAYRLYVVRNNDIKTMRTLYFANYSQSHGWYGSDTLINAYFDVKTGKLSAFGKGRGLGDCGNAAKYSWNDFDFKMTEYRAWDRCDGSRQREQWPLVYKAKE